MGVGKLFSWSSERRPLWQVTFQQILKHAVELSREKKVLQLVGTDTWLSREKCPSVTEDKGRNLNQKCAKHI